MSHPGMQFHDGDGSSRVRLDVSVRVRDLTLSALRAVVAERHRLARRPGAIGDGLREACTAAREEGMHAEELIVIVKQSWRYISDSEFLDHNEASDTLSEVVTACINEFYRREVER